MVGVCVGALVGVLVGTLVGDGVGHAALLHACVSAECGHALPPCCGGVTLRLRCWLPPPHCLLHADHALQPSFWPPVAVYTQEPMPDVASALSLQSHQLPRLLQLPS